MSYRYRFVELYYRRSDSVRKGRTIPARIETVVIYLPDIRSCIPTRIEWDALQTSYKLKMEQVIASEYEGSNSGGGDAAAAAAADGSTSAAKGDNLSSSNNSSSVAEKDGGGNKISNSAETGGSSGVGDGNKSGNNESSTTNDKAHLTQFQSF